MTILTFLFFTALVGALTIYLTRSDDHKSVTGYFLAGRNLSWPFIAGSLLLTNISTEQMVGLNGAAYVDGLAVMAWEVIAVVALVAMALFFLPRFLKYGVTTVPEYLGYRFDGQTAMIANVVFLAAYALILLPIILYTGATGLMGILDLPDLLGIESETTLLWLLIWVVGIIGSLYALFGGLRTVAVSDTLNGVGLLAGGFLITWFGLEALGNGDPGQGLRLLSDNYPERLNSIGEPDSSVPFSTLFTGVLLLHMFYWTTNQQIIQRTLGARSLAEGQKGVMMTAFLKLLGPFYLVLPGIIAFAMFPELGSQNADQAYGRLVNEVLPPGLAGFFAAAMLGAILSSFNSVLNSTCTLYSLGIYRRLINRTASDEQVVRSGKLFGWILAVFAMSISPLLMQHASIFGYLQKMNGLYFIPILAVVACGMLSRRVPAIAARYAMIAGIVIISCGYFIPPFTGWVGAVHEFHFLGIVFLLLTGSMLLYGRLHPADFTHATAPAEVIDMRPWPWVRLAGAVFCGLVVLIYLIFADFSVL